MRRVPPVGAIAVRPPAGRELAPVRALVLPLLLVLAAGAACTSGGLAPSPPPAASGEETLLVGRPADVISLDPARVTDALSAEVCEQVFDHLTRFRPSSLDVAPALAESWDVSPSGTVWTFHLRRGVRFHDGTPFNADAVIFSFERQRDPRHPYHRASFPYGDSTFRNIVRIERVDDLTVRITIERPYAPFLANLSMFSAAIVSPAAVRRWGDDFERHPVGTGPFRFVEWQEGERITLEANPTAWRRAPRLRHLVFATIRDARQRLVSLEGGAIDVAESLAPEDLQFVALHPELKTHRISGNSVGYLAMNTQHAPFQDVRVRRAFNHAINRVPIVKLVYQGLAQAATGPLPPTSWAYVAQPGYAYDPALARRLLAEARYDHRLRPKLYVMDTSATMPTPLEVARIIAANLHEVGVEVEIVSQPFEAHVRATQNGEHDLCLLNWTADTGDPDNFLYLLFDRDNARKGRSTNVSFLDDAELHGILRWAQETQDRREREGYYAAAQRIIQDRAPWVPLAHSELVVAMRGSVVGAVVQPSEMIYFDEVSVERR